MGEKDDWLLFFKTGNPVFYLLYRMRKSLQEEQEIKTA